MENQLELVANRVSTVMFEKMAVDKVVAFDPAILSVIIAVLQTLAEQCNLLQKHPEDVPATAKRMGFLQAWTLRRLIKKEFDDRRVFREYGDRVYDAILKVGENSTVDEVKALVDYAG